MDRTISASEANQRFAEMLRDVAAGESFTVTSRGKPVARVIPIGRRSEQSSVRKLLEFVRRLPRRHSCDWPRADLYE